MERIKVTNLKEILYKYEPKEIIYSYINVDKTDF